jgi:spermidine synthase
MILFLYFIFFTSGTAALIFETLWFRQAGLGFGNSVWASSLVLSGFMAGLALGNLLAARYGSRLSNPIRIYALTEVAIALSGLGLVYLFPFLGTVLAPWLSPLMDNLWIINILRFLLAFLLLMIPTTAMGLTLPLLTKALSRYDRNFGRVLGQLYGWNTLGAVLGVVVSEFYLIRLIGIHGTAASAALLGIAAAGAAGWLSVRPSYTLPATVQADPPPFHWTEGKRWLLAAFVSGLCLLALEVIWFRFLILFAKSHSSTFAVMLGVVLAGIAFGGLAASLWLRQNPTAYQYAPAIAFGAGLLCTASYWSFPLAFKPFESSPIAIGSSFGVLSIGAPLMFPVSFLSGIFFTFVGSALRNHLSSESTTTGILTVTNTAGSALGSLIGGFILLPVLGMERSFFAIAVTYGMIGAILLLDPRTSRRVGFATAALFLAGTVFFPFGMMNHQFLKTRVDRFFRSNPGSQVAAVREGLTETIIYIKTTVFGIPISYSMLTNSFAMSGTQKQARRYMKLYVYWPMAVHPNIKSALLICYGVGNTAKALTDTKTIESIDVVDISRDILEMNKVVYPDPANLPLNDPRVHTHIEDGRYFLQTTTRRFDLITGEPPPPQNVGVVNLYTREYFQLIHNRLADGGIVAYWLPLHALTDVSTKAILRAFCDVFEDCSLWNGMGTSLMMVGTRNASGPVSEAQFTRQWRNPPVRREMAALGFERPEQLGALFIGDAEYLRRLTADSPPLVDNNPKLIEAPFTSQKEAEMMIRNLTDYTAARKRFRTSPLIKRLWPERMRTASLPYFDIQKAFNYYFYAAKFSPHPDIEHAHFLLAKTSLVTPALWLLGSGDIQAVLSLANASTMKHPFLQYHLGIRLISQRQYARAIEPLSRAEENPSLRADAFRLRIYALCMAGQTHLAQESARSQLDQVLMEKGLSAGSLKEADLPPFWLWMKETFGIDPLKAV